MKSANLIETLLTKVNDILAKSLGSLLSSYAGMRFVGSTHLQHDFNLLGFNDHVRLNQLANVSKQISGGNPSVISLSGVFGCLFSRILPRISSKNTPKPFDQVHVRICDTKDRLIMKDSSFLIGGVIADSEASFTIDDSCKVSNFSVFIGFLDVSVFRHFNSMMNVYTTVHDKQLNVQPQRSKRREGMQEFMHVQAVL